MLAAITTHDVPLIATIAVSLAFAFVGGLLAVRLGLPPLVGIFWQVSKAVTSDE